MKDKKIISALDIADWLCQKANAEKIKLSETKIQHLLFLAQIHFAVKEGKTLMPSLFVCGRQGFYEANIRIILNFGIPLMKKNEFSASAADFLELIWKKYGRQDEAELTRFIFSLDCWKKNYRPEEETIVNPVLLADSFAGSIQTARPNISLPKSKILLSQNGPVKVSAWNPRKLGSSNQ